MHPLDSQPPSGGNHISAERAALLADIEPHEMDTLIAAQPWSRRPRLTWAAYVARCQAAGRAPDQGEWLMDGRMDADELAAFHEHRAEEDRTGYIDELAPYLLIRSYGGKARVGWFDDRGQLQTMSHDEFRRAWREKLIEVKTKDGDTKVIRLVDHWLDHPRTPRHDRVEFLPGVETPPEGVLNLWRGWPDWFTPGWSDYRMGINGPEPVTDGVFDGREMPEGYCDMFLDHMRENMCGGDEDAYRYLLGWIADMLNNPGPSPVAIILRSDDEGTGKGFWAKQIMKFVGPHGITVNNPRHVVGNFNAHLMNKSFVYADEAFFAGNHQHAAALKTLVTDDELFVEPKGVDGFMAPKHWRLVMASNDKHVIRASKKARRWLVLNVDAGIFTDDKDYFAQMDEELRGGGLQALGRWLTGAWWREQVGENRFKRWPLPKTAALDEQKDLSMSAVEMAVHNMLALGEPPCCYSTSGGRVFVPTTDFKASARLRESDTRALGLLLSELEGEDGRRLPRRVMFTSGGLSGGTQLRGHWLPPLPEARARFEARLGRAVPWPEEVTDWAVEGRSAPPF